MKKIEGRQEVVTKVIEVGAKYVAEDGKVFSTELGCKQYEERLSKKKLQERIDAAYQRITENCIDDDFEEELFLCKFNTKEEFINVYKTLHRATYNFNTVVIYMNGNNIEDTYEKNLPAFPMKFVVSRTENHDDDFDWENFDFISADDYVKALEKKIEVIKKL